MTSEAMGCTATLGWFLTGLAIWTGLGVAAFALLLLIGWYNERHDW